jgi:rRNA pseudouridine-1189 N-methylase Emg1 (Nep1/Mra1 family)
MDDTGKQIIFIHENVNKLSKEHKVQVLQMICESGGLHHIREKGNGTQIRFKDIRHDVLTTVNDFIINKMKSLDF